MPPQNQLYATCASGLDALLAAELEQLGATSVNRAGAGVRFSGGLEVAYKACLWSRVANRVLLPIHSAAAASPEALYDVVQEVDWSEHLDVNGSLAVDFFTANSEITHSQYGALKVKDAVVDQFREKTGIRPNVNRDTPDVRINVYLFRNKARIAIDLSGSSLHRRGYREQAGPAPLKENLAAALLLSSDWPSLAEAGCAFVDPLCGSGTLAIEAAMIACNQAPGLYREYFGFLGWRGHDVPLWQDIKQQAEVARTPANCTIVGADSDARAVRLAQQNAAFAQVQDVVEFRHQALRRDSVLGQVNTPLPAAGGLVLSNPPYGERLAINANFYAQLGSALSQHYAGWQCGLFTAVEAPLRDARLPLKPLLQVANGGIDCALYWGSIPAQSRAAVQRELGVNGEAVWGTAVRKKQKTSSDEGAGTEMEGSVGENSHDDIIDASGDDAVSVTESLAPASPWANAGPSAHTPPQIDIEPVINRLRKNQKAIKGWLKSEGIKAWRVYDADLPEFAVAIDIYDCAERHVVVQEYQAPATVNRIMAEARLNALLSVLPESLSVPSAHVHLKLREQQKGLSQYEKQSLQGVTALLEEQGCRYELNLSDYLDTGLFLDHRKVRKFIRQNAQGKRFLNLFAYTGSATITAMAGGASSSVSVDLSNKYCSWMQRNFAQNSDNSSAHEVVRSDVNQWLQEAETEPFDIILLDPPTFSNSTGIDADWNVQRDHVACIQASMARLKPGGVLIFSNNYRRFKIDPALSLANGGSFVVEDRSRWSIDKDFQRNARIHQCWFIRHS